MTVQLIPHWIDGARSGELDSDEPSVDPGRIAPVTDPATGVVTGAVLLADEADAERAIASAARAFPAWRDTSVTRRTQILFAFRELLNARKGELAAIVTAEHGKVLSDALGEVSWGLEVVESPFNFPAMVPSWSRASPSAPTGWSPATDAGWTSPVRASGSDPRCSTTSRPV